MVKKIDKAEFIARLDGTLEEKIYQAYYYGYEHGHEKARMHTGAPAPANWEINVAYSDWQIWLMNPETEKEVEK